MNQSQKVRVQNVLMTVGKAGQFHAVTYDKDSGLANDIDFTTAPVIAPVTCLANETASSFVSDRLHGREEIDKRQSWTFDLLLGFEHEVTLERFEESLIHAIIRIPRTAQFPDQVTLRLIQTSVQHPVTQQPSLGTQAKMQFQAVVSRS